MLKNVNLPVLFFKKVNLPITNRVMNRLLLLGWCLLLFTACNKADDPAVINTDQTAIDKKIIDDYLAANGLTGTFTKVKNIGGRPDTIDVYYKVEKDGPLSTLYSLSSSITVGFTGRVLNSGKVFTQTSGDVHPSFALGEVLKGWQLGVPNVKEGGTIRLIFASRYGYGPYAQPNLGLPANAVLDFTIDVFDVTN
jgi:FKBP-type peptidyl-prolyl cis-trans isomerase FkpA